MNLNDFFIKKSVVGNPFKEDLKSYDFGGNTYLQNWLTIMRDYPYEVMKLRLRKPNANLSAAEVMRSAMRFQMSEVVLAIAAEFPRYQIYRGHSNKIKSYIDIVNRYRIIYDAELEAKMYSADINRDFVKNLKSDKLLEKLNKYLSTLDELAKTVSSFTFQMFYYELQLKRCELMNDQDGILRTCREALVKMEEKRFKVSPQVLFAFTYPQLPILIQHREFDKAKAIIKKWSRRLRGKNNNWFVVHSYDVIQSFRMLDFARVRKLLKGVDEFPTNLVTERYHLFNAYSALFERKKINVNRFVNDVYEHQKDKRGYNIPIIIVQLLHLIQARDDDAYVRYIDSLEGIDRYLYRYVKEEERSFLFIKMLLMIPKCDFQKEQYLDKTATSFKELQQLPLGMVELEPIPYEVLYKQVLKYLK